MSNTTPTTSRQFVRRKDRKHTKGPWLRDKQSGLGCDVRAAGGRKVALTWGLSTSKAAQQNSKHYRDECDANAHVTAAGPEMLDLLDALHAVHDSQECPECGAAWSDNECDDMHTTGTASCLCGYTQSLDIASVLAKATGVEA